MQQYNTPSKQQYLTHSKCSYNNIGTAPSFLQKVELDSQGAEFFPGACFSCAALDNHVRLQRCAGCQLVSYCNKNCQKKDWRMHKFLCKKYPVENGKNVIVRKSDLLICKDPTEFRNALTELSVSIMNIIINMTRAEGTQWGKVFDNARVCNICYEERPGMKICHEAQPEKLFYCRCCVVSYCSEEHRMQDDHHMNQECDILYSCAMANWYLTRHQHLRIPDGLLKEANLNDGLKYENVSKLAKFSNEKWLETIVNLINERLTFPLTIHHALKKLKLGEQGKALSKITSLTIHIVHDTPMLDPRMWEFLLHQIPNLNELNLTFISGDIINKYNACLPVERCSDCKRKQRVINYNIQPMNYHEYFSSDDYVQPDVVAVFDVGSELMLSYNVPISQTLLDPKCRGFAKEMENLWNNDRAHSFTSQRNMIYNKHTVVILTDSMRNRLLHCVKNIHDDTTIKLLLPVQKNPVCLFSTTCRSWPIVICKTNDYLCCIQRKL